MSNNTPEQETHDDMLPEYDFSGRVGVRGKYHKALREGYTIKVHQADGTSVVQQIVRPEGTVMLDPDVREYFPDAEAVNTTLRALIHLIPGEKTTSQPS